MALRILVVLFIFVSVLGLHAAEELYYQITSEIDAYGPIFGEESVNSSRVVGLLFLPLLTISMEGDIEPVLLKPPLPTTGVILSDLTVKYSFTLKEGIFWSNGQEVTVEDVIFTFKMVKNDAILSANNVKDRLGSVIKMVNTGRYTFDVIFENESQDNLGALYFKILPKSSFPNINPEYEVITKNDKFFQKDPVSNGLYKVKRARGTDTTLRYNDGYKLADTEPRIQDIQIDQIDEPSMIIQNFLNDDDINFNPDMSVMQLDELKGLREFKILQINEYSFQFLAFNLRKPIFQDLALRQAMTLAIDKVRLNNTLYRGFANEISGPFPPGTFYNSSVDGTFVCDVDKANDILKENKYFKPNLDSSTREKDGQKLKFTLLCKDTDDDYRNISTSLMNMYKEIGIEIEWEFVSEEEFTERVFNAKVKDFDIALVEFKFGTDPNPEAIFKSDFDIQGGFNVCGLHDDLIDRLFDEVKTKRKHVDKIAVYNRIHEEIAKLCPGIFLWQRPIWIAYHESIEGLNEDTLDDLNIFRYIDKW